MTAPRARVLGFVFAGLAAAGCTAVLGGNNYVVDGANVEPDGSVDPDVDAGPCNAECGGSTPVCVGTVCHECAINARRCDGASAMACSAGGKWVLAAMCPFQCAGAGVCSGACNPGTLQCSGNDVQTCSESGIWQDGDVCPFGCTRGVCSGTCVAGSKQCVGSAAQVCDSTGTWKMTQTCPFVCSQEAGACSGVCVPGVAGCSGAKTQLCNTSGNWDDVSTCSQPTPDCQNGACFCLETTCPGGACVNLQTDPQNCGVCAHDCGAGAACAGGQCQPATIASSQSKPWGIALDATGVYWTNSGDGTVQRAATAPLGSAVTLATGQTGAQSLVVAAGVAYWVTYDAGATSGGTVEHCAVGGCSNKPTAVATGQTGPWGIAVDAANVYWSVGSSVSKAAIAAGTATTVGSESKTVFPLAVDATNAYWADSVGSIFKCALAGCASSPTSLATQSFTASLTAGSHGIAIDATNVYFTNDGNVLGQGGGVWRVPLAGGSKTSLGAGGQTVIGVAVDATNVYFADNSNGTIMKAPISGATAATTIASGQGGPWGVAVDATFVYWTNQTSGTVMRVAK